MASQRPISAWPSIFVDNRSVVTKGDEARFAVKCLAFCAMAEVRIARTHHREGAASGFPWPSSVRQQQAIHYHTRMEMDNRTSVAYVNRQGGTTFRRLCQLTFEMWKWAAQRNLILTAVHVPGKDKTTADRLSRQTRATEWELPEDLVQKLLPRVAPISIDLFAARNNAKLRRYVSWGPNPDAWATNASLWHQRSQWTLMRFRHSASSDVAWRRH